MIFSKASNNDKAIAAQFVVNEPEGLYPSECARLASAIHSNVGLPSHLLHGENPRNGFYLSFRERLGWHLEYPAVRD